MLAHCGPSFPAHGLRQPSDFLLLPVPPRQYISAEQKQEHGTSNNWKLDQQDDGREQPARERPESRMLDDDGGNWRRMPIVEADEEAARVVAEQLAVAEVAQNLHVRVEVRAERGSGNEAATGASAATATCSFQIL